MNEVSRFISALWEPYIKEIKRGGPVYFCFFRDSISRLFLIHGISGDPVENINRVARLLFVVDSDVSIKPEALQPHVNGFSAAIIFVAQQVLAVEEMVRERDGFSEYAYFPRLRKMISSELREVNANPFSSFDEFEKIWRTLAKEIRSLPSGSEHSITFRFGEDQGVDKARSFPFSQALLTSEDLNTLIRRADIEKLRRCTSSELWSFIRSEKSKLGRRAQRLLGLTFLRDRIIEQIKSYSDRVRIDELKNEEEVSSRAATYEIRFYKDSIDWLNDEFRVYLLTEDGNRIDDEERIRDTIIREINSRGFLALPPGDYGDSWSKTSIEREVSAGDSFILVGSKPEIERACKIIGSILPDLMKKAHFEDFSFLNDIFVQQIRWPVEVGGNIWIRNGAFSEKRENSKRTRGVWMGGLSVDSHREKFLNGSLPDALDFDGDILPMNTMVSVNDRNVDFNFFYNSLDDLIADQTFEITFPGGIKKGLSVAVARGDKTDRMGYLFDDAGKMSATLDRVSETDLSVIGFMDRSFGGVNLYSLPICACLLKDLRGANGKLKLTLEEIEVVKLGIDSSPIPDEVKLVTIKMLEERPFLLEETRDMLGLDA